MATLSLGVMGVMGAMLAVTGIFGMAAYSVSKRLKEFGIRIAVGAQPKELLQAALGRPFKLLAIGSTAGLIVGFLASRVLALVVYQATPRDPLVLAGAVLAMALVGLLLRGFRRNARCRWILWYCCARSEPGEGGKVVEVDPGSGDIVGRLDLSGAGVVLCPYPDSPFPRANTSL